MKENVISNFYKKHKKGCKIAGGIALGVGGLCLGVLVFKNRTMIAKGAKKIISSLGQAAAAAAGCIAPAIKQPQKAPKTQNASSHHAPSSSSGSHGTRYPANASSVLKNVVDLSGADLITANDDPVAEIIFPCEDKLLNGGEPFAVKGHIMKLGNNRKPSPEKKLEAESLGIKLEEHETWISDYVKNKSRLCPIAT